MTTVVRAPRLLCRVLADRVLLRRVGGAACDLHGAAALAWAAADEPAALAELEARVGELHPAAVPEVAGAVQALLAEGLLREVREA